MKHFAYALLCMLAVMPVSAPSSAQEQSLKSAIVGTWVVQELTNRRPDGKEEHPWGTDIAGHFVYSPEGGFTQVLIANTDPALKTPDARRADGMVVAYVGTYTVNEADKTVHVKISRGANSVRNGVVFIDTAAIEGDKMVITGGTRTDQGGSFTPIQIMRRFKQ